MTRWFCIFFRTETATPNRARLRRAVVAADPQAIPSPEAVHRLTLRRGPGPCHRRPAATAANIKAAQDIRTPGRVLDHVRTLGTADAVIVATLAVPVPDAADM